MKPCVSIDWDGTLHQHAAWRPDPFGAIDADLIRALQARGFAVAISTSNELGRVADALRALGFTVNADYRMKHRTWSGGPSGRIVLITNRKVAASCYLGDRAVSHRYGDDHEAALEAAMALAVIHRD